MTRPDRRRKRGSVRRVAAAGDSDTRTARAREALAPRTAPVSRTAVFVTALLGILALAAGLRVLPADVDDYWYDELYSLLDSAAKQSQFTSLPIGEVFATAPGLTRIEPSTGAAEVWSEMRRESHPPLYFVLLHAWRRVFGDDETAVRSLSALFSVAAIVPAVLLLRELRRPGPGLALGCMLAVSFIHVHVGQDARPYALAMLLVSLSWWIVLRIVRGGSSMRRGVLFGHAVVYGLLLVLTMLTHYFAGLALLAQSAYAGLHLRRCRLAWWGVPVVVSAGVWALLWLPSLLAQLTYIESLDWVEDSSGEHLYRTLVRAADLPVRLLFATPLPDWSSNAPLVRAVAGAALLALALFLVRRARTPAALPFALWYLVPWACLTAIDLATGRELLTHLRFSSFALPGLAGLLVLAAAQLASGLRFAAVGVFAVMVALTLTIPATWNPHARLAAHAATLALRPGDLLLFDARGWPAFWARRDYLLVSYYLPPDVRNPVLLLQEDPDGALVSTLRKYPRIVSVSPRVVPRLAESPNPAPAAFTPIDRSLPIREMGCLYVLERNADAGATPD